MKLKSQISAVVAAISLVTLTGCCCKPTELTFVHMTDSQFGFKDYDAERLRYEDALRKINLDADNDKPEFMLMTGDMVHVATQDHNDDYVESTKILEIPHYDVAGNHDFNNTQEAQDLYAGSFGEDYYWFDSKNGKYRVIVVNTNLWHAPNDNTPKMDKWFADALEQAKQDDKIIMVAGHHPIFVGSADEPTIAYSNIPAETRPAILQLFKDYGVIAYFGGHTHTRLDLEWEGIRFLHAETTCLNFDNSPYGYRIITVKEREVSDRLIEL